jgi:class 3 adenylate cyclase
VEFQDDGERIALTLYALDGREFFVAAKRLKSLRDPRALDEYVRDIQNCLGRHGMAFNQQVRTRRDD